MSRLWIPSRAVWVVLAVQVAVTAACGALFGTWQDEEYTLATTAHGVLYAYHRAIDYELQAPIYFVVLAALRSLNDSVFFARAFSIVAAAGFTYAAAMIARRIAPRRDPWVFAALVALNPFTVFAALEIRLYALALLVSALLWIAFYDGYFAGERRAARVWFAALALAALYLQYFLAFELFGFAIALVAMGRWRSLASYALAGVAVVAGFVPMALVLHAQVGGAFAVSEVRANASFGGIPVHPALDFLVPLVFAGASGTTIRLVTGGAVASVAAAFAAGRPVLDRAARALAAAALAVQTCYLLVADVLHYELSVPRHFVALFVPEVAAAYALVAAFSGPRAAVAARALAAILACASVAALLTTYRGFAKQGDWPRVGAYLSTVARPGDTIAVFEADAQPALARYYRGGARIVPFPRPLPADRYSVDAMIVHSVAEGEAALAALPRAGRVWLVRNGDCDRFDRYGCQELLQATARRERIVSQRDFFQTSVAQIEPK